GDFLAQSFIDGHGISAHSNERRGGSSVRARSHGGNVSGEQNEKSSRSPARTGGRNVNNHGNRRGQDVLDDVFHRIAEPAGSVHGDEYKGGVAAFGIRDAFINVGGENRLDLAVKL